MTKMAVVKGGKGKLFGQSGAGKAMPGTSSPPKAGKSSFRVSGGKTKMFGKQTVKPARYC